jgi:hypothetical protein
MPNVRPFLQAWDRIPVRAITIFFPFPPLFSFFCHIQTFFYTNMNIFITLLENVNKSRTSANNLSLIAVDSLDCALTREKGKHARAVCVGDA